MKFAGKIFCVLAALLVPATGCRAATYEMSAIAPPKPAREFRGAWIATVANIDWPSKPGLSTAQQKGELISILDRAAQLKLNAVIFQVRPACDAFYASRIEPWSEYLTGIMGKAPEPFYDPLEFAITEAHRRGLELHAWFNPYRALHKSHEGSVSSNHVSKTRPDLVRHYGEYLWLDPGERDVQDYSLSVVMDVVKRYDIDGVQFDDYFYPDSTGVNADFPDQASWKKFGASGSLSRDDWRRENVNTFIERVYRSIKSAKPWVKFGISPFGIWRPGNPPGITGSDAYAKLYGDSRKWLANGWVDYFAPQLYWPIEPKDQSFPALLAWWSAQNVKGRHLWPGIAAYKADKWRSGEIEKQIELVRKEPGASGCIFYGMSNLTHEAGLITTLRRAYSGPALVPASPWLAGTNSPPPQPGLSVRDDAGGVKLNWNAGGTNAVRWWVVQAKNFGDWKTEVFPGEILSVTLSATPEAVAVTALDRAGVASVPRVLQLRKVPPPRQRILLKQ